MCLVINRMIKWQRTLLLLFTIHYSLFTLSQIGTWHNYLAYYEVQNICTADNYLFVLASNGLYQYNQNDQSITTYDKVSGLSDTYITHIAWNPQAKRLIAVYQNSNIDLIDLRGNITNISALYSKIMTEDKTVSKITIDGIYAWLHCGFGYVKVNVQQAEISDSYSPNHPDYPASLPAYDEYQDLEANRAIVSMLSPGGPKYNYFFESQFANGKLYTTGGYYLSGITSMNYPGTIQVLENGNWTIFEDGLSEKTGYAYSDINCVCVDPTNEKHVVASGRCGLYEFQDGKLLKYHNQDNSPLKGAMDRGRQLGNNYVIINGIQYDKQGNLWVLNSQAQGVNLFRLTKDGDWEDMYQSLLVEDEEIGYRGLRSAIFDSRGYLWFVNTAWGEGTVFCYDINSDKMLKYNSFVNQDGTRYNPPYVYSLCEDLEQNIWVATSFGPFVINSNEVGNSDVVFNQIKVARNDGTNYADYLLNNVDVRHIAVDGGNRKWFATIGAGTFLISADNQTQLYNFKSDNSYLLSDNVYSIAINNQSGEVYFLTDIGLCSYTSDATAPVQEMSKDNVYAYPNPVTPDFTGLITIVGLSYDADIKIVASNGALIAEGRSNGGTFTWDGKDSKGNRVASGVYMVLAATSSGSKGTVCKIAVIN